KSASHGHGVAPFGVAARLTQRGTWSSPYPDGATDVPGLALAWSRTCCSESGWRADGKGSGLRKGHYGRRWGGNDHLQRPPILLLFHGMPTAFRARLAVLRPAPAGGEGPRQGSARRRLSRARSGPDPRSPASARRFVLGARRRLPV